MSASLRHTGAVVVAASLAVALVAPACGGDAPGSSSPLPRSPTELPTFDVASFQHLLASLHGTPVVVNVWASWCGPCVKEAPALAAAARAYAGRVQFLGVDVQDQPAPARRFIQRYGWTYPSVFDPAGSIRNGMGFLGQPDTVFYDRSGNQAHVVSGNVDRATLDAEIAKILAS